MRWIALLLLAVALAGCGDDASDPDPNGSDITGREPMEPNGVANETRDPVDTPSVVSCPFSVQGGTVAGTEVGSREGACSELASPINANDPLPFRSALIELAWDAAEPTINQVGVDVVIDPGNASIEGGVSTAPGGMAGVLMSEETFEIVGQSTTVDFALVFQGVTADWSGTAYVSLFETESVPEGYSAV